MNDQHSKLRNLLGHLETLGSEARVFYAMFSGDESENELED